MTLPRYPEYRPSGAEWLGEVPAHWRTLALRHVAMCLDGERIPLNSEQRAFKQGNIPYWGANGIVDYIDEHIFDQELVLLGEDGAPFFDRTRPVAFVSTGKIWPNNHIHVLKIAEHFAIPHFISYSLNIVSYELYITGSTRDKLNQDDMKSIPILCPPLPEQRAIVAYLDRETARLDDLIEKKRRLLALLKERRTSVITHAVTKGLPADEARAAGLPVDPPMKDSGVEWLGEVPAHWVVRPLGALTQVITGFPFRSELFSSLQGTPLIRIRDINAHDSDLYYDGRVDGAPVVTNSDVLVGMDGDFGVGRWRSTSPGLLNQRVTAVRTPDANLSQWIEYALPIPLKEINAITYSTTVKHISLRQIQNIRFAIPNNQHEMELVVRALNLWCGQIDALAAKVEAVIGALGEYRTALITAAVTGQVDVRGAVEA